MSDMRIALARKAPQLCEKILLMPDEEVKRRLKAFEDLQKAETSHQ